MGAPPGGGGGGGEVVHSFERLLAAVLLTTTGPGALSQWLSLVAAVYFLAGLLHFLWRVRWLFILGIRVARGMPGPRARRRALCTFAARPATVPPQGAFPDVIVASSMRSGGTWASHIAHQLRMRGANPEFFWQEDVVPWLDAHQELFGVPAHQHPQPCLPRLFRATATCGDLVDSGVLRPEGAAEARGPNASKVVYVFRDLCDVCYSLFFYFPALFQVDSIFIQLEDFVWCARLLLVERSLWSLVHFWRRRFDPGVLFLFYEELMDDDESLSDHGAIRRMADFVVGGGVPEEELERVREQTRHSVMSRDDNWDRFSGMSVAVLVSERLGVGYRYELEPYLGKVSRIGGKTGQGRRVLGEAIRELFDEKWTAIVTKELGFRDLGQMQQARRQELADIRAKKEQHADRDGHRGGGKGGVGKRAGVGRRDGVEQLAS